MKSLGDLLRDKKSYGVYRVTSTPPIKELEKLVKAADCAFFHIEGQKIEKKEQFLNHAALAMHFPEDFGNNWDAFEDCLTDLSWVEENHEVAGYVILFDHFDVFAAHAPNHFDTLLEVFRDAAAFWHNQDKAMFVLLHGKHGAELDLKTI
jgi:RNAse (barnase) inhibitor barstar